jgi:hypothetical protein
MIKAYRNQLKPGFCRKGTRAFFEAKNLDWNDFVKNGIDVEILEATGDAMAVKFAQRARDDAKNEQSNLPDDEQIEK